MVLATGSPINRDQVCLELDGCVLAMLAHPHARTRTRRASGPTHVRVAATAWAGPHTLHLDVSLQPQLWVHDRQLPKRLYTVGLEVRQAHTRASAVLPSTVSPAALSVLSYTHMCAELRAHTVRPLTWGQALHCTSAHT